MKWIRLLCLGCWAARAACAAEPMQVVTTIFPLTDWVREIGGERVAVRQLLPPGVEAHAFAPRPSDLRLLQRARMFLFLGPDMEPWAAGLLRGADREDLVVVEAARDIPRQTSPHEHEASHGHDQHEACAHAHADTDPHVWLDPVLAGRIVLHLAEAMGRADPEGAALYTLRAEAYRRELDRLHERIEESLRSIRHREILYGGHFAFGYFARRYGLRHVSPYPGFSPNAAPTPSRIAQLIRALRDSGQTVIFHEELVDPRVARVVAEETGARLQVLHGAHNLTKEEWARGDVTYLSLMERNLGLLVEALGGP